MSELQELTCAHCKERIDPVCGAPDHPGFCCDCFDLSWFYDIPGCMETLNAERAELGKKPLPPWPEGGYRR